MMKKGLLTQFLIFLIMLYSYSAQAAVLVVKSGTDINLHYFFEGQVRIAKCAPYTVVNDISDCVNNRVGNLRKVEEEKYKVSIFKTLLFNKNKFQGQFKEDLVLYSKKDQPKKLGKRKVDLLEEKTKIEEFVHFVGVDQKSLKKLDQIKEEIQDIDKKIIELSDLSSAVSRMNQFVDNLYAQILDETTIHKFMNSNSSDLQVVFALQNFVDAKQLSGGGNHSCAITRTGLKCWGESGYNKTTPPVNLTNPKEVSSGWDHNCAIDDNGVQCWGSSSDGQLSVPTNLSNPKALYSAYSNSCVVDDNGVQCWGRNSDSQLNALNSLTSIPTAITGGYRHNCALDKGNIQCWGSDGYGQLKVPANLSNPTLVSSGHYFTCASTDNGIVCWGQNSSGQTTPPSSLNNVTSLDSNADYSCAINNGKVVCWGSNTDGQCTPPANLVNPTRVFTGGYHACALTDKGLVCWGKNGNNRLVPPAL